AEQRTVVAKNRGADAGALGHLFRADLDWIVMKCLDKDRARRYETANGLAMDITRHLSNEPIIARPPSAAYRFQKLVRRNKLAFAAAGAVAGVLVLAIVVSTWQAVRATNARQAALVAEGAEKAQRQLAQQRHKEADAERQRAEGEKHRAEAGELAAQ